MQSGDKAKQKQLDLQSEATRWWSRSLTAMSEIILFGWLGYWLDSKLETSLCVVIGFVLGLVLALVQLVLAFRQETDAPQRGQVPSGGSQDSR